eukprot:6399899-Amphidinium_carterae.1
MSSESQQAFKLMVTQPGVPEDVRARLAGARIDTMAKLAYRSKGKQGELSGAEFEESVLRPLANEVDGPAATAVRKLYLESYTRVIMELKHATEGPDTSSTSLPENEKTARLRELLQDSPGVQVHSMYEPSAKLIDKMYAGVRCLQVPYVRWMFCTSRKEEMVGMTKAALAHETVHWAADNSGVLREKPATKDVVTDLSTDLRVSIALHRRGVAAHIAGVMSFGTHRKIVEKLLEAYLEQPPQGCQPISMSQMQGAD